MRNIDLRSSANCIARVRGSARAGESSKLALDGLADAATRDKLKRVMSDPERLRPGESRQALTERAATTFAGLAQSLREHGGDSRSGGALRQPAGVLRVRRGCGPVARQHLHADAGTGAHLYNRSGFVDPLWSGVLTVEQKSARRATLRDVQFVPSGSPRSSKYFLVTLNTIGASRRRPMRFGTAINPLRVSDRFQTKSTLTLANESAAAIHSTR